MKLDCVSGRLGYSILKKIHKNIFIFCETNRNLFVAASIFYLVLEM